MVMMLLLTTFVIRTYPISEDSENEELQLTYEGNYTIIAIINANAKIEQIQLILDWVANGQSGKTRVIITFNWDVDVQNAEFDFIKFYIYVKADGSAWYLYTTKTSYSQSSATSVSILFDDLDDFFDSIGKHLDDGNTHTIYLQYDVSVQVTGAYSGETLSQRYDDIDLGSFTLKWEGSGSDGGGGLPPGGVDIINATTYKTYLAIPLASIPPVLVVTALYLDVFSPRFSKPTAKIRELMKRRRRGKKKC